MRPIHFDVRRISISQLHQLYRIFLIYFVFVYFKTNRFAPDELKKSLFEATGRTDFVGGFLDSLEKITKIHTGSVGEQQIKAERWMTWRLHQKVWQEVVQVVGLLDDAKPESLYYFMTISESAYKDGITDIQAQLNL